MGARSSQILAPIGFSEGPFRCILDFLALKDI
jgi:hypothetical protein